MSETVTNKIDFSSYQPHTSELSRFSRVFFSRSLVIIGLLLVIPALICAIFAPAIAPYNPYEQDLDHALSQPSREHLLGTDTVGRDLLSRIIYGARTSMIVALGSLCIASLIGFTLGLIAGYFRGIPYLVIMRSMDAFMSFPMILLALTIASLLGGGLRNVVIALGVGLIPSFARLICGQVLSVREYDFITAQQSLGAGNIRIMGAHIAPNCFPPIIVQVTLWMGHVILSEAGLSFLGIGIEPPGASWGAMVSEGYQYLLSNPVLAFSPGLAIMLVVFGFNMIGDGLRDALDPKLRGVL